MPRDKDGLTPRRRRFVEEYLIDLNATQAALRAGYSPRTAKKESWSLLTDPAVRAAVAGAQAERSRRTSITADRVLEELASIAFADIGDFVSWGRDGVRLNDSSNLAKDQRRAVAEVYQTKTRDGGSVRFKLHDKRAALSDIGRHLGMFKERHEHSGPDGGPIVTEDVTELTELERAHRLAGLLTGGNEEGARRLVDLLRSMGAPARTSDGSP